MAEAVSENAEEAGVSMSEYVRQHLPENEVAENKNTNEDKE